MHIGGSPKKPTPDGAVKKKEKPSDCQAYGKHAVKVNAESKKMPSSVKQRGSSGIMLFGHYVSALTQTVVGAAASVFALDDPPLMAPLPEMDSWMARIYCDDRKYTRLSDCAIVGSHDSATCNLDGIRQGWVVTQTQGIKDQLQAGVRYLDVRITKDFNGRYVVHHDSVLGGEVKNEVIHPLQNFLEGHSQEVVILKMQFSGVNKQEVLHYLKHGIKSLSECHALPVQYADTGRLIPPGHVTFAEMGVKKKNLIILVSDSDLKLSDKLDQADLGGKAWLYRSQALGKWANSCDMKQVLAFNQREALPALMRSKACNAGKLGVLQMQTNPDGDLLEGGLKPTKALAGISNPQIPGALKKWHKELGFVPNIVLQDFISHFNFNETAALLLAMNTKHLSESHIKSAFPDFSKQIIRQRKNL